jgi:metal-sulfur cluster biosynthetic enzyme
MSNDLTLKTAVEKALYRVLDPELGASLMDLGMIKSVTVKDGVATIEMRLTTPFCPLVSHLTSEVKKVAESVKGILRADVKVVEFGFSPFQR